MKKPVVLLSLFFTLLPALVWASPPVPFSGKVSVDGINYHGPASGSTRVRRGGSWKGVGTYLRSAKRLHATPSDRSSRLGFRVGFQQQ